jgi:DNA-binding NtrC family response regulator
VTRSGEGEATKVLVADDHGDVVEALGLLLKGAGFATVVADSPASVLAVVEREGVDVALIDLNYTRETTSGKEGLDLLTRLRELDPTLPVVVMTAWGSIDGAVAAVQRGARDYVAKPWDNARLVTTLETQAELGRALRKARRLEGEAQRRREKGPELVGSGAAMQAVRRLMQQVAGADAPVLITGEHGTGKDVVARMLHTLSERRDSAFVAINASGLGDGVFESELFGHVKGAFTDAKSDRVGCVELADRGTLFLDEIGDMPKGQQAKLLRVLQTGEYQPVGSSRVRRSDFRLLVATNADLPLAVREGRFREDLLYRVNAVEIRLPALRERREDIPALTHTFLERTAARYRKDVNGVAATAMAALLDHPWPGNVRELEHVIERAVLLAQGPRLEVRDLMLAAPVSDMARLEMMSLDEVERVLVVGALKRHGGNVSGAAQALGLSRSALYRRLQQYGIKADE